MSVTERMKKVLSILLCLCMVLSYVPTTAFATAEDGLCEHHAEHTAECGYVEGVSDCTYHCDTCLGHSHEEDVEEPTTEPAPVPTTEDTTLAPTTAEHVYVVKTVTSAPESDLPGNDELFAMYAEQKLYGYEWSAFGTKAGEALTGDEKLVYDALIPYIKGIAAGTCSSAVVGLGQTLEDVDMGDGTTATYTADTAVTFIGTDFTKAQLDSVVFALLADYPYEMYWYDKVTGTEIEVIAGETLAHLRVSMTVAANYRTGTYYADTAKTGAAAAAAAKAQSVISANAGKSDYEKLAAYKKWICDNVSYNTAAAEKKDFTTNSDPWQLIYAFDGDSNTNVVCEGYSKAFQYLCDLGGLDCICADGTMTGGTGAGPHMWNVVTLDGKNYLVDVTNCDEGTVGAPDALFLVGGTYAEGGYSYTIGSQTVTYTCADLSLAATHYDTGAQTPDPVCTCESKCSEGSVNSTCVICSAEGADLTACTGKVAEVRTVYVGGVELNVGEYLAVDGTDGAAEKPEGGYAYLYADGEKLVLELNNYDNKGGSKGDSSYSAAIWSDHALTIDLKGENTLTNTAASGDGIYAAADLTISGTGKLTVEAGTMGIYCAPVDYRQSATVHVTGGYLFLNVKTYGIWAGAVEISGGEIVCTNTAELNNMIKAVPGDGNGNAHPGYLKADAHTTIVTNCEHVFSTEWSTNETHHWHSCTVSGCATIHNPAVYSQLENAQYGEHEFVPTTGKCACGEELAVASVTVGSTTTYYETLPAAVTAARASENSTLTLLKDIDLGGEDLLITSGTFTIDLNDCTYTSTCLSAIRVEGATVTITDNGPNKTGTVQGEFKGVEVTNYGTVNITGGTITAQTGIFSYICGTINISGGTVIGTGTSTNDAAVMSYGSDSMVNITGGSISGTERDLYISSASLKLTLAKGKTEGARFPGGITVHGKTLAELLSDTVAYWAVVDGKDTMLAVADDATGITDKGDITIRAACGHADAEYAPNADGTTHTWTCGVCQTVVTEEHSTGAEGDKALTCTMPAYCSVCESEYGEPVGHNWVNGFCTNEIEGVVCDDYEPATLVTNENYAELGLSTGYIGYYAIENAGQLYWFAEKVDNENDTYKTANVVLTANINVNVGGMNESTTGAREWNPIGYWNSGRDYAAFNGTFDGNNKKISGLYANNTDNTAGKSVALIAETESGALVKNVTVTNTWFHGYAQVAGIVGDNGGTITGCVSEASLSCTWSYIGGMAGWNEGTITGCINRGTIAGKYNNSGGIAGHNAGTVELCGNEGNISDDWCFAGGIVGNNAGIIRNCWNTGTVYVTNTIAGGIAGKNNPDDLLENCWSTGTVSCGRDPEAAGGIVGLSEDATQRNCYSVMDPVGVIEDKGGVSTVENMDQITLDQFASGEVAYLLRTRAAAGTDVWGQNIDNGQPVQTVPALNGADVYYGYIDCHSTEAKYTNTAVSVEPVEHSYDNGFCTNELTDGTVCDAYEPAVLVTAENREELGLAESYIGYYAINNGGNLYWFADKVDNENATYGSVNVVLTADVTVNEGTVTASSTGMRDWNPIGWFTDTSDDQAAFSGTFDGNGKSISGLYFNNIAINGVSLFAITGETALVKNVTVTNSYFCGNGNNSAVVAINYGTVSSCFNEATLSGYAQIGGIVGRNLGLVELCGNTGTVYASWAVSGGVVARSLSNGPAQAAMVKNCWNTGNISSENKTAGGIVGESSAQVSSYAYARVENCWSTGSVSAPEAVGGVTGDNWRAIVSNCYSVMAPVGVLEQGAYTSESEQKTLNQFASGEVAYLLGGVWGQDLDNGKTVQTVPTFTGAAVYYGYTSCGSDAVEKYTNNENASATKPEHMGKINYTLTEDGTQHIGTYECCDTVFTEDHDFENEAHQCVCGKVETITITFDPANGEEKIVITQDYGSSITAPENPTREGFHFVKWDTDIPATMPAEDLTIKAVWEAHTLVYSVNGSTITVTCSANCGVTGTASITAESKTYDSTPAVVDYHCSGIVDPAEVSLSVTKDGRYVNGEDLAEAGTYTASITLGMGEEAATASVDFTIAKKELTAAVSGSMSKSYDGTNAVPERHSLKIILDGVISGDTVSASADFAFAGVNAGTTTINATNIALSGKDAANYELKTTTASADVGEIVVLDLQYLEPHDYDIVFGTEPVYNGKEQTMTVESFVMCGLDVTYELTGNTGTDAGFYAMVVTANGNFAGTITQEWQISRKAVTVTAEDQTITYGETISGTEITADGLVDGHSATVTLTPSTANVTASGTITASAAIITADGTDVTSNYEIAYTNGKLVIEPDTSRIDGLTTENVTSANEEDIKAVQEVLEKADSLKDEWKDLATTCEDMIEKIEAVEKASESVTEDAAAFDAETVNSADKEALEQLVEDIEALLDTDNLTKDERAALETVQEQVEGMIDTINETAEDSKAATDSIEALDPETVTSDDKDELEQAIDTIDELLKDDHLTEEERSALEGAKEEAEALIEVIEAAQDAANTEAIQKVEDVSAENVKPEDKEALEDAKADLEKALEDNAGNYTEEEKKTIQEEIQRIEDAFEALENARDVTEAINALPETVEPDDETAAEQILDAKKAYDELTDHEKSLVGEENKKKLDDMVAALIAYDIIKGDGGKWTQGSSSGLSFTANGPFSKFAGIEVDGKEVDEKYYEAKSGSTIITLKQSYLKKLSAGEHTITVLYTDGETSGTFKILEQSTSPATGDDFNIMLYGAMFTVSLAGLVVLLLAAKKRKRENA